METCNSHDQVRNTDQTKFKLGVKAPTLSQKMPDLQKWPITTNMTKLRLKYFLVFV